MSRANWCLVGGPLLASGVGVAALGADLPGPACWTAAVTALCAVWWVLEPIPIPATSLIPFFVFPLTGVLSNKAVAGSYGHELILLLLGGFILSTAMERSGAHRRLALGMVRAVGWSGRRGLVLGFMLATALCSMWISNTATVLMMLPIALAVLDRDGDLSIPLLLGIAYAASVGGMGTPIGTPPNIIFQGIYREMTGQEVSFAQWMQWGVPVVVVFIPVIWLWITRNIRAGAPLEVPHPGAWRPAERRVLILFAITALGWILRSEPFGGWKRGFSGHAWEGLPVGDDTVALAAVVALFVIPDGEGGRMLDWKTAERIPWGLLLLFGGGLAIANAFKVSGLSTTIGEALRPLTDWPTVLMIAIICLAVTFLTEVTSNTATTTLLMPVLASAGLSAAVDPVLLMVPAALSASCAFMLPVATAPNAIVFGTGHIAILRMAREGVILNLLGAAVITTACLLLLPG
ncbi:MAG: SLC13 family permease [Planctomycetota bacterium]